MSRATTLASWWWAGRSAFALGVFVGLGVAGETEVVNGLVLDAPPLVASAATLPAGTPPKQDGFLPGIGRAWAASGRFGGRGHSDGVLD